MRHPRKETLLVLAGTDFDSSYAGTKHLLDALAQEFRIVLYVYTFSGARSWYSQLPYCSHVLPLQGRAATGDPGRIQLKLLRAWVLIRMLFARRVLITETTYLREAAWAKRWRGRRLFLAQFCQELVLPEEYPYERWPETQKRLAHVPDLVIDVNARRASHRQMYYGLDERPFVLPNTFPLAELPLPAPVGELWRLAECPRPLAGIPVLLHAGGVGREKPFERIIEAVASLGRPCFLLAFCVASKSRVDELRKYAADRLPENTFCIRTAVSRESLRAAMGEADIGVVDYAYSVEPTLNQKYCEPSKLYEFMASGLAVLGSDNDSMRDIIEKNDIGCCARGDSPGDLAQALGRLLDGDLAGMKFRAKRLFVEKYSYEKLCGTALAAIFTKFREWAQ